MNKMKRKKLVLFILIASGLLSINLFADPPEPPAPPNPGGSPAGNENPVGAPLDSVSGLLVGMGVLYGIRFLKLKVKRTKGNAN